MRTVVFESNLRNFRGAHLKLWNYFNHVREATGFPRRMTFTDQSRWDGTNPWTNAREFIVDDWRSLPVDIFFLGGRHWKGAELHPEWAPHTLAINIIHHVNHADPAKVWYRFLRRRAIRIRLSAEVRDAIRDTGLVQEPMLVIPNGIEFSDLPARDDAAPAIDLLIAALTRPDLGQQLLDRLQCLGRRVQLLTERLPRVAYPRRLGGARVTVFRPNDTAGFYQPALEGMAAGTLVVCPDCIGNQSFCLPGYHAFLPIFELEAVVQAAEAACALPAEQVRQMRDHGHATAGHYSLDQERAAFHDLLLNVNQLWQEARGAERSRVIGFAHG